MTYTVTTKNKYEVGDKYGEDTIINVEERDGMYILTVEGSEDESDR